MVLPKYMNQQMEYSQEELSKLSEEELMQIMTEPGWVIKGGKVIKVGEEEYRKAIEDIKGTEGAYTGETI